MFETLRKTLAKAIAPPRKAADPEATPKARKRRGVQTSGPRVDTRMYQSARSSRLTAGFGMSVTSADSELVSSLTMLRSRTRQLVRDAAYAKRAKVIVQNNVVYTGIGLQAQVMNTRGELREAVNDAIEEAFEEWACSSGCHTAGQLHFADIERLCIGQVFDAGEVFLRKRVGTFGDSKVPFSLEVIEPERVADEFQYPVPNAPVAPGATVRMGVEQDDFGRPLAYWIRNRHPGDLRYSPIAGQEPLKIERVPADQIYHLRIVDRWPQTRGEPWLHAVARKLNDMDAYSEAEVVAARSNAVISGTIETQHPDSPLGQNQNDPQADSSSGGTQVELETGLLMRLAPGETMTPYTPSRPNAALDPFMRAMLREVAAGVGVSYESLSRDYSQSNYSSSRLALLDDRDLWRVIQGWFIRQFRYAVHRDWLKIAVYSGAIPAVPLAEYASAPDKFECARFKPRGWSWIDPVKEVTAYKEAVRCGFMTVADVINITGGGQDLDDVLDGRRRELGQMHPAEKNPMQMDLVFDTDPAQVPATPAGVNALAAEAPEDTPAPAPAGEEGQAQDGGSSGRVVPIKEARK